MGQLIVLALTCLGPFSVIGRSVLKHLGAHPAPSEGFAWLQKLHWAHPMSYATIFNDLLGPIWHSQHNILRKLWADLYYWHWHVWAHPTPSGVFSRVPKTHWAHPIQSVTPNNDHSGPIQYSQHNILRDLWAYSEPLTLACLDPFKVIGSNVLKQLWAHPTPSEVLAWLSRMHWAHPIPSVMTFNDLPGPIQRGQHSISRKPWADSYYWH